MSERDVWQTPLDAAEKARQEAKEMEMEKSIEALDELAKALAAPEESGERRVGPTTIHGELHDEQESGERETDLGLLLEEAFAAKIGGDILASISDVAWHRFCSEVRRRLRTPRSPEPDALEALRAKVIEILRSEREDAEYGRVEEWEGVPHMVAETVCDNAIAEIEAIDLRQLTQDTEGDG